MAKIYTRKGDSGLTGLLHGVRVEKSDPRIEAIGCIDELNCAVGVLMSYIVEEHIDDLAITQDLFICQNNLFTLGSQLADTKEEYIDTQSDVTLLEERIDAMTEHLAPLKNFILPAGNKCVAWTHYVRTVTRRAERTVTLLNNTSFIPYLNRLSDYFFTLARFLMLKLGNEEIIWQGKRK